MKKNLFVFVAMIWLSNICISQDYSEPSYKFTRVMRIIDSYYVDTTNIQSLVEHAVIEVLKDLDPHSIYMNKDDVRESSENLEGNFEGIGIEYSLLQDTIFVISTVKDGPSYKAGILPGDRIIKVNDTLIAGVKIGEKSIQKKLRGQRASQVSIDVLRKGVNGLITITITRDRISIHSVEAHYLVENKIGYIRLNRFAATSVDEFQKALSEMTSKGMEGLILDLRDNGGGYLNVAIDLADEFLEPEKLIVYTEGINAPRVDYNSTTKGNFEKGDLVVLIDEGSASASEILAGAIQDWDRGVVLGRRSYGKGLVQRPFTLNDGSMVRLTTSRYYTPTGRLIQKNYKNGVKDYKKEIEKRFEHGELSNRDSIRFNDSLKYYTLTKHRKVYGGGGIMPDVFIPLDTSAFTDYYKDLIRDGILNEYVLYYIDNQRQMLNSKYPDFAKFNKEFTVDDKILNDLSAYAKRRATAIKRDSLDKKKIEKNKYTTASNNEVTMTEDKNFTKYNSTHDLLRTQIKAMLARDLWAKTEFYRVMNEKDDTFTKAVEILKNKKMYDRELTDK